MAVRQRDMQQGRSPRQVEPVYWDEAPPRRKHSHQQQPSRRTVLNDTRQVSTRGVATAGQRNWPQAVDDLSDHDALWSGRGQQSVLDFLDTGDTLAHRDRLWEHLRREDVHSRQVVQSPLDGVGRRLSAICTLIVIGLSIWLLISLVQDVTAWGQTKLDDLQYGYPRTSQADGYLGYGEHPGMPSHIVAMNLHGQVVMTIFTGGDPRRAIVIRGPHLLGTTPDEHPVTVSLTDVNGDGYADIVARVADQTLIYLSVPRHHSFVVASPLLTAQYVAAAPAHP